MILVGGEALVDLVLGDDDAVAAHLGGGPFNCARTLGRLEQPVAYLGRVSTDRFGARLRAQLEADGVGLEAVVTTEEPTTLALAELDAEGTAAYRFYVDGTSAAGLTVEDALAVLPDDVEMIHTGTLGLVFEPTATAIEAVIERIAASALVMLDLNCRPSATPDPQAYRARLARLLPRCDVVKASDADLEYLDPGRPDVEAARALLGLGPAVVLLTRGGRGATVVTADGEAEIAAPQVEVADTIGAGDAFGGGFLAWWRRERLGAIDLQRTEAVLEATRFACLVAARTCERPGASPPRLAEL
jgi:fructokinase